VASTSIPITASTSTLHANPPQCHSGAPAHRPFRSRRRDHGRSTPHRSWTVTSSFRACVSQGRWINDLQRGFRKCGMRP
jgi:hypothetical protein